MLAWIAEHWEEIMTLVYAVERILAMKSHEKERVSGLSGAIEKQHNLSGGDISTTAKALVPDKLKGDIVIDTVLDIIDPKTNGDGKPMRRVSKGRRALNTFLQFLPLVSRLTRKR